MFKIINKANEKTDLIMDMLESIKPDENIILFNYVDINTVATNKETKSVIPATMVLTNMTIMEGSIKDPKNLVYEIVFTLLRSERLSYLRDDFDLLVKKVKIKDYSWQTIKTYYTDLIIDFSMKYERYPNNPVVKNPLFDVMFKNIPLEDIFGSINTSLSRFSSGLFNKPFEDLSDKEKLVLIKLNDVDVIISSLVLFYARNKSFKLSSNIISSVNEEVGNIGLFIKEHKVIDNQTNNTITSFEDMINQLKKDIDKALDDGNEKLFKELSARYNLLKLEMI